jgi:hypothetical protein
MKTQEKIRSKFYRTLTPYMATGIAEGFEVAENEEQRRDAWQYLHDTRLAYSLQGFFGRTAQVLIKNGIIED